MEVDRFLRGARAAVFAVVCVGVSAAGHRWMSGGPIPAWALALALLATGIAAYLPAARERGFAVISTLMLAGELGLHLLFAAAQAAPSTPTTSTEAWVVGWRNLPASAWLCGPAMGSSSNAGMNMPGGGHGAAAMVAAHAVAGLACSWWLRRGELALFRLLRRLARLAVPLFSLPQPVSMGTGSLPRPIVPFVGATIDAARRLLVHIVIRRGPPQPCSCM